MNVVAVRWDDGLVTWHSRVIPTGQQVLSVADLTRDELLQAFRNNEDAYDELPKAVVNAVIIEWWNRYQS